MLEVQSLKLKKQKEMKMNLYESLKKELKNIKVAQSEDDIAKAKQYIFESFMERNGGRPHARNGGRIVYVEITDEASPQGTSYIQIYAKDGSLDMCVERYYESEFAQDEYGSTTCVPINFNNPDETVLAIEKVMQSI